jgi:hypothetical protein
MTLAERFKASLEGLAPGLPRVAGLDVEPRYIVRHHELAALVEAALAQPRPEQVEDEAVREAVANAIRGKLPPISTEKAFAAADAALAACDYNKQSRLIKDWVDRQIDEAEAALARPAPKPAGDVLKALRDLLDHVDRETCPHEDTHRGGLIWTVCDACGRKWADDEGGFVPYSDPPAVARARLICEASPAPANAAPASEREGA